MSIFKRLLSKERPQDKRQQQRFAVGAAFPFKPTVTFANGQVWDGRVINLSANGARIQLPFDSVGRIGEPCHLRLALDQDILDIPATVAQFRCYTQLQHAQCSLNFVFADLAMETAYNHLLEPVKMGASLVRTAQRQVAQDTDGLTKEQYCGFGDVYLNVWRNKGLEIVSFDFHMQHCGIRWCSGMTDVQSYIMDKSGIWEQKMSTATLQIIDAHPDVRWLFCLSIINLSSAVPFDVRKFLSALVTV